jgi:transcription elongation regulator 1
MQSTMVAAPKKDKPLMKTPVSGTPWVRVKTVQGNTFYNNKETKISVWTVPDEIRDIINAIDEEEAEQAKRASLANHATGGSVAKRKADAPSSSSAASKKAKMEAQSDEEDEESEEEDWQRDAAAQLAAEAEAEKQRQKEEKEIQAEEAQRIKEEMEEKAAKLNLPRRQDLSLDEAKALFKVRIH